MLEGQEDNSSTTPESGSNSDMAASPSLKRRKFSQEVMEAANTASIDGSLHASQSDENLFNKKNSP